MTMRHRNVIWSEKAVQDLKDHADYILERNEDAALRVAKRIREAGNELGRAAIGRPGHKIGTYERVLSELPYSLRIRSQAPPLYVISYLILNNAKSVTLRISKAKYR